MTSYLNRSDDCVRHSTGNVHFRQQKEHDLTLDADASRSLLEDRQMASLRTRNTTCSGRVHTGLPTRAELHAVPCDLFPTFGSRLHVLDDRHSAIYTCATGFGHVHFGVLEATCRVPRSSTRQMAESSTRPVCCSRSGPIVRTPSFAFARLSREF
jgi:hypothetical protein